jgi:hypothetical protein
MRNHFFKLLKTLLKIMTYAEYQKNAAVSCGSFTLPPLSLPQCLADFKVQLSQVGAIYLTEVSAANNKQPAVVPTADTAAAWAALLGNTGTGKIRKLPVIGSISEPTAVKQPVNGEDFILYYEFKIEVATNDFSSENYAFCSNVVNRELFGWVKFKGGLRFGTHDKPIKFTVTTAAPTGGAGNTDVMSLKFVFEFKHENIPVAVFTCPL